MLLFNIYQKESVMKVLSHIRPEKIIPEAMKNPAQVLL